MENGSAASGSYTTIPTPILFALPSMPRANTRRPVTRARFLASDATATVDILSLRFGTECAESLDHCWVPSQVASPRLASFLPSPRCVVTCSQRAVGLCKPCNVGACRWAPGRCRHCCEGCGQQQHSAGCGFPRNLLDLVPLGPGAAWCDPLPPAPLPSACGSHPHGSGSVYLPQPVGVGWGFVPDATQWWWRLCPRGPPSPLTSSCRAPGAGGVRGPLPPSERHGCLRAVMKR